MKRTLSVVALLVVLVGCGRGPSARAGSECKLMARRCSGEIVQLCLPDAATKTFQWVSAVDCAEYDDVCEEDPATSWADCSTELDESEEAP